MRVKIFISILLTLVLPVALAQEQSHPLSQIKPIDVNLDMFGFNITNVTFVGINLTSPQYALDIVGDVRWSGVLRGGIVPWERLSDYNLDVVWSGKLGWGNLTGYNLNVNWQGKLGWGNLTNYPNIITNVGSGLNAGIRSLATDIILEVNFTETQRRVVGACSGSKAIQVINADGSVVCIDINFYGNVTGTGTPGYIPIWQTSSSLADSLINQTAGNVWITSGSLNIVSGALQIGGINVIDSSRNLVGINLVNQNLNFGGSYSIYNVNWVNATYLNVSAGLFVLPNENVGIGTTSPAYKLDVAGDVRATGAVYSNNGYYVGATQIITSGRILQNIASVSQNLLPTSDNSYDLGNSSYRWKDAYFGGIIYGNIQGSITPTGDINMNQYSIYNANWVNASNLNASNAVYASIIRATTIYQGNNQVIDTISANAPISVSGTGNSRTIGLNYDNNFTLVGNSLSLSNTGVAAGTYGSASQVAQFTVNAQGRITSANNVLIQIDASQIVSGIISSARLDSNVAWLNRSQTWTASQIFNENVWFNKNVFIAGNLSYVNVNTLNVNGSLIPIFNNMFDIGNLTYKWRNVTAVNIVGDNVYGTNIYQNNNEVLDTATSFSAAANSDITVSGTYNNLDLQIKSNAVTVNEISQVSCPDGSALRIIGGGSYACVQINTTKGVINGSGVANYIPVFTSTYTIGSSPFYLTSNNLNLGQQSLINASWVNASYLNVSAGLIVLPSGNVGIGTTYPVKKLDVVGDVNATGDVIVGSNLTNTAGKRLIQGGSVTDWLRINPYDSFSRTAIYGDVAIWTDGTGSASLVIGGWESGLGRGRLKVYSDTYLATAGGNVGIGTASPAYKLDVAGDIRGQNNLYISGNVGIGTTTPAKTLHVSGAGAIIGSNVDNTLVLRDTRTGINWNYIQWEFSDGSRDWVLGRESGTGNFVLWNSVTEDVITRVEQGAPSNTFVIKSTGNVGIGTTAPMGRLSIEGGKILHYADGGTYLAGANRLLQIGGGASAGAVVQNVGWPSYRSLFAHNVYITETDPQNIEKIRPDLAAYGIQMGHHIGRIEFFKLTGTASPFTYVGLMTILDNGNVGIGTTSPSSKLEVYGGDIEINDGAATGSDKIKGLRMFYAGDETQVSTTSTSYELKKQFTAVFNSNYGIKPRYVNVLARIWNSASGNTTSLNVTLEGCGGIVLSTSSTSPTLVPGTINTEGCSDGLYPTKVYLSTTSGGTAYNDLIEFYYVG